MSMRLLDLPLSQWPTRIQEHGGKAFHGRQAARWLFQRAVCDWTGMTDLPAPLREQLSATEPLCTAELAETSRSEQDGAVKVLLRYPDGSATEAVAMPGTRGLTFCLSTQVGCPVRCTFCASGLDGLQRNLSAGEILEQFLYLQREIGACGRIVIMGMGDPAFNLDATLQALDSLIDESGAGLGARRITISTVAPRGALERIATWGRPVTVALSVHAPDDALRQELVPGVAKRSLAETLEEADRLFARTGREFTVEYVLLDQINDHPEQASSLARQLRGRRCHVNLIPYNPVPDLPYRRPPLARQQAFAEVLRRANLAVTLRRSLGRSVDAACGQLRRRVRLG